MTGRWQNIDGTEKYKRSVCHKVMWFPKQYGLSGNPQDAGYKFCPNYGSDLRENKELK